MARLVAIDLPGGPGFVSAVLRAWEAGDAVLPLDTRAPAAHNRAVLDAMAPAMIVDRDGTHDLGGSVPVLDGDAVVVATSGTTGAPKGAVHTHSSIEAAAAMTSAALGTGPDATWLACLPLSHVGGFSVITRALRTGAGLVVHDGFEAAAVDQAARMGADHVSLVPAVLARIRAEPWHRILLGGSAIPARRPPNTVATYGMTETFGGVVYEGRPLAGVEVRVAGADDVGSATEGVAVTRGPAPAGVLEIRSPTLLRCYRDRLDPAGGPAVIGDGWFRTGDAGRVHPGGTIEVEGRADELIISGGEKVWPVPVERRLEEHPAVREAAVVAATDDEWGQRVVALVVPEQADRPPSLDELRDWVKATLPAAAAPRELLLRTSLPRTSLGKLARHSLREAGGIPGHDGPISPGSISTGAPGTTDSHGDY